MSLLAMVGSGCFSHAMVVVHCLLTMVAHANQGCLLGLARGYGFTCRVEKSPPYTQHTQNAHARPDWALSC